MGVEITSIQEMMREMFPNGDPKFLDIMMEQIDLYNRKNKDYASAREGEDFDPNGNFNRVSAIFGMYPGLSLSDPRVFALALLMKQFDQVCWSLSRGFEGEIEGLDPKLQDLVIYFVIIRCINAHMTEAKKPLAWIEDEVRKIIVNIDLPEEHERVHTAEHAVGECACEVKAGEFYPNIVPCTKCGTSMALGKDSRRVICWSCEGEIEANPLDSDRAWCQCGCELTVVGHTDEALKRRNANLRDPLNRASHLEGCERCKNRPCPCGCGLTCGDARIYNPISGSYCTARVGCNCGLCARCKAADPMYCHCGCGLTVAGHELEAKEQQKA